MRLRKAHRRTATKPGTDRHVLGFGARLGYWPCLRAPFVQVSIGSHIFEAWFGLPSYKED